MVAVIFTAVADVAMGSYAIIVLIAAPVRIATGLGAGIHRAHQARRGGGPYPSSPGRDTAGERRDNDS